MASVGTATVKVNADTASLESALRIIAKHAQACADELAAVRTGQVKRATGTEPSMT